MEGEGDEIGLFKALTSPSAYSLYLFFAMYQLGFTTGSYPMPCMQTRRSAHREEDGAQRSPSNATNATHPLMIVSTCTSASVPVLRLQLPASWKHKDLLIPKPNAPKETARQLPCIPSWRLDAATWHIPGCCNSEGGSSIPNDDSLLK